jgi:hypothetical protein
MKRWEAHKRAILYEKPDNKYPKTSRRLYSAMRSYGIEAFSLEIIQTIDTENFDLLDMLEVYYINQYHTFIDDPLCQGYNLTSGGRKNKRVSVEVIKCIQTRQKDKNRLPWNKDKRMPEMSGENW